MNYFTKSITIIILSFWSVCLLSQELYDDSNAASISNESNLTTGLNEQTDYNISIAAYDNANPANISTASSPEIQVTTPDSGDNNEGSGSSVWSKDNTTASYYSEVAIGTNSAPEDYKLAVEGKIRTREIRVDQNAWPDFFLLKIITYHHSKKSRNTLKQKDIYPIYLPLKK